MKIKQYLRLVGGPARESKLLLSIVFFWLLLWLAKAAGLLGLWLMALTVPAFARYLFLVLESRALGLSTPLVTLNTFNPMDRVWLLFPLVPIAAVTALLIHLTPLAPRIATGLGLLGVFLLPLSLALLAVSHAPLQSVNPLALFGLLTRLGPGYLWAPLSLIAGAGALVALAHFGVARVFLIGVLLYVLTVTCTVTGQIVAAMDVRAEIDIPDAEEVDSDTRAEAATRARQQVLNHAYGVISRGNRDGGFAHLASFVTREADPLATKRWFFNAMLQWESKDAALFYAQRLFTDLLDRGNDIEAMKLIARCVREDPRFQVLADDRERAMLVAERLGNRDVIKILGAARVA
jgi:hypothetical protein